MIKPAIWAGVIFIACASAGTVVMLRRRVRNQKVYSSVPDGHDHPWAPLLKNGNGANNHTGSHRRKTFDYHKFYSDMMLQVSSGSSSLEPAANGKHISRESNGRPLPNDPAVNQVIVRANCDLITNQTNLIEEQKRLMHEQSKLIEEKSRLIREKNQLLEKQAELFERDLL